jgi:hypothetical protein
VSDVLGNEPRPGPRWLVPVGALAAVAVLVAVATHAPKPPPATHRPAPLPSRPSPAESPLVLHRAGNACQSDLPIPSFAGEPLPVATGLRLLVGDRDLRIVNVDLGTSRVLAAPGAGRSFTSLHQAGRSVVVVSHALCGTGGPGDVATVNLLNGDTVSTGPGDVLLPGEPPTVVELGQDGAQLLRPLHSLRRTPLPTGWTAAATSGGGFVIGTTPSDPGAQPTVGIGDPTRRRFTRTFGKGYVVAAAPNRAVWLAGTCNPGPCLLTTTAVGGPNSATQARSFPCCGTFSPDGRHVAFILPRTAGQLGPHPGPPSDIAVLDFVTTDVQVLRGLVLPAKTSVSMAWSRDSAWLVLGADAGSRPLVMVWRDGMQGPAEVPLPAVRGGTTGPPAVLVLADQSAR